MTTFTDNLAISHANDADFRAWGSNMSGAFDAMVKFPKAADSGQINWATVARPAGNVAAGYEIRYLNDSLNATAPLFVKIEYGTDSTVTNPAIWITVGKGSNGAGTITGILLPRYRCTAQQNINTTNPWPSYFSCVDGFIGMLYRSGASSFGLMSFIIQRTVDDSGAPTGDGIAIFVNKLNNSNFGPQLLAYTYSTGFSADSGNTVQGTPTYTLRPFNISATQYGPMAEYQALRHWTILPLIRPLLYTCSTGITDNLTPGMTFQAATVGTTLRTYIQLPISHLGHNIYDRIAMIWE